MRIISILSIAISGFFLVPGSGKLVAQGKGGSTYSTLDNASNFVFEPQIVPNVQIDRFQWGFDTGVRYDDNLFLAPEGAEEDGYTYHFSPDFLLTILGDHYTPNILTLGYGADFVFGDGVIDEDVDVNQDVNLTYRYQSDRTRFAVRSNYSRTAGVTGTDFGRFGDNLFFREIGRARSDRFGVQGDLDYRITNNLYLDVRYGYNNFSFDSPVSFQQVNNLNDYSTHGGQIGLNFGNDRFHIGPYVGAEWIESVDNASQDAFQVGGAVSYEYSALTSFFAQAGYDNRSFNDVANAADDRSSFIWSAGLDWHPTHFSSRLSASRTIIPSAVLDNQNLEQSSIDWAIRKEFAEYWFGRFVTSYAWIEYDSNIAGTGAATGDENFFSGYVELGRRLADWGSAAVYYRYLENESDDDINRAYENNTVGFRLSVDF